MGSPRKLRKKYSTPSHPWNLARIEEERPIVEEYGLKNKKEVWKTDARLKRALHQAKRLIALDTEQSKIEEKQVISRLIKYSLLKENSSLDDILNLKLKDFLDRRLQTIVLQKKLAQSTKQARQFITHGHISINKKKVTVPSYLVKADEENTISYLKNSSLSNPDHAEVAKIHLKEQEEKQRILKKKEEDKVAEKKVKEESKEKKIKETKVKKESKKTDAKEPKVEKKETKK